MSVKNAFIKKNNNESCTSACLLSHLIVKVLISAFPAINKISAR